MKSAILGALITLSCLAGASAQASEAAEAPPCVSWDVKAGMAVDKAQAMRLYLEAVRLIGSRFRPDGKSLRPCLTVHVGETCPSAENGKACVSPVSGDVYLPAWDAKGAAQIAQASVATALLHLVDRQELAKIGAQLLVDDERDYVDAMASARPPRK